MHLYLHRSFKRLVKICSDLCYFVYLNSFSQRRRGLRKSRRGKSCIVPTDTCKFTTDEITGAQKFNFSPKFPHNEGFLVLSFVFLEEHFRTKKFSNFIIFIHPKFS